MRAIMAAERGVLDVGLELVAGDWDPGTDWEGIASRAIAAAFAGAGWALPPGLSVEVAVRLTDDAEMQALNRDWRGRDRPTNILSFPMLEPGAVAAALAAPGDLLLGDLAVGHEPLARESAEKGVTLVAHFSHLLVHGTLHLLGHDHADDASAERMEGLETAICAGLGIADPYAALSPL
jgi:probable rRNA maturation factor